MHLLYLDSSNLYRDTLRGVGLRWVYRGGQKFFVIYRAYQVFIPKPLLFWRYNRGGGWEATIRERFCLSNSVWHVMIGPPTLAHALLSGSERDEGWLSTTYHSTSTSKAESSLNSFNDLQSRCLLRSPPLCPMKREILTDPFFFFFLIVRFFLQRPVVLLSACVV